MIVYTCPECGNDLHEITLTSYPAQRKIYCSNCGWSITTRDEIFKIPYQTETTSFVPEACRHCSNHPSNGGSGICHCTLGGFTIT